MKQQSPFYNLSAPQDPRTVNADSVGNFISPDFILVCNFAALNVSYIPIGQPILSKEYRLIRMIKGEVRFSLNMRQHTLRAGQLLVTTPGTILELEHRSDDLDMHIVVFRDLPPSETFDQPAMFQASEAVLHRIDDYFNLLGNIVQSPSWQIKTVRYLLLSLFSDLRSDRQIVALDTNRQSVTRAEDTFNRFLDLLNQYSNSERRVPFYAERLHLSPNRLSAVIKDFSGQTVMDWINRHTVQQAKVMLRFTDKPIYEIGMDLGFENAAFFAKFFRRETGMTPKDYRTNGKV